MYPIFGGYPRMRGIFLEWTDIIPYTIARAPTPYTLDDLVDLNLSVYRLESVLVIIRG